MVFPSPANPESTPFERDWKLCDPEKLLKVKAVKSRMADFSGIGCDGKSFIISNIIEFSR